MALLRKYGEEVKMGIIMPGKRDNYAFFRVKEKVEPLPETLSTVAVPPVQLHYVLDDGQPEPGPSLLPAGSQGSGVRLDLLTFAS
jgi:hypothetical protein